MTAIADFHKCGAGRGAECCAYLVGGGEGAECGREQPGIASHVVRRVAEDSMRAQRLPKELWPECMKFSARER